MADFFRADLRGSRFERVDLSGSEFRNVDLTETRFRGAAMSRVVMRATDPAGFRAAWDVVERLYAERDLDALAARTR